MALTRINNQALTNVTSAGLPSGSVLQVKSKEIKDRFVTSSTSFVDVTGFNISITPQSSSNKIMVMVSTAVGSGTASRVCKMNLLRGSTLIAQPTTTQQYSGTSTVYNSGNDELHTVNIQYLDSPATTSAVTYKIQVASNGGNMTVNGRNSNDMMRFSSITVMEIAG